MTPIENLKIRGLKGFSVGCVSCNEGEIEKPLFTSKGVLTVDAMAAKVHATTHELKNPDHLIVIVEGKPIQ